MTKVKKSFLEILTGAKKIDEEGNNSTPIYAEEESEVMMNERPRMMTQPESTPSAWTSGNDIEGQLTIDVYQTETDIVIKSTIAGVKPEDLDVAINNDMVTIRGERKNEEMVGSEN